MTRPRSVAGGTEVIWTSTFRIAIPLIGGLLTRLAARNMAKTFSEGLAAVDELARAKASA